MKKKRTLKQRMMSLVVVLVALYVIYCGAVFILQGSLIYPAGFAGEAGDAKPTADTERLELTTDEGTTVAWLVPAPAVDDDGTAPLVVFLHGNAELIDHQQDIVNLYRGLGAAVLLIEYRGYGHSNGTPVQASIVDDAVAIIERVVARDEIDADRLVLHGRSIGGMLAAQVALRTKPAGLIVESSGRSVAGMSWRYGVPPFLVRSPLRTEQAFGDLDIPILIMHGRNDEIFAISHAEALHAAASDSTLVLFDASHNTLPNGAEIAMYNESVGEHLRRSGF